MFQLDFKVKFPLLRLLQFLIDLKSTIYRNMFIQDFLKLNYPTRNNKDYTDIIRDEKSTEDSHASKDKTSWDNKFWDMKAWSPQDQVEDQDHDTQIKEEPQEKIQI